MLKHTGVELDVNGIKKRSVDITYDDLIILYNQFIAKYGRIPLTADGKSKNNLPQQRIIKRILADNNISYNDFINQFGKYTHVRSDITQYDNYVERFKILSTNNNGALKINDLINNSFGLPSAKWFVDNCPDNNVKTYDDFVIWCGFNSNKRMYDKTYIINELTKLQDKLNRPILSNDITYSNVGFSMIVIDRIWGGLDKCKKELGLLETLPIQPKSYEYYKSNLENVLSYISGITDRKIITWKDIENVPIEHSEHKTYLRAFRKEGLDIFAYIKSKGFLMNPSTFSFHYTFDSGERVVSSFEYDFSNYINSIGYIYKVNYFRDYMYRNFIPNLNKSRINCDYYIDKKVIEIAGMIHNNELHPWEQTIFSSKQENDYKEKLLKKKSLLEKHGVKYLLLFPEDFYSCEYKNKFQMFIN